MTHSRIRLGLSTAAVASFISVGASLAQTPTAPPTQASPSTTVAPPPASSTVTDIEKWTTGEWEAAKAKWSAENAK
jgi:hypothetical protein